MKILITGAGGFIGSYLMDYFSELGYETVGVIRTQKGMGHRRCIICDISKEVCLNEQFEVVIHTAAESKPGKSMDAYIGSNILGTKNIVRYALNRGSKIIFLSSTSIFGKVQGNILSESSEVNCPDNYGISKLVSEKLVLESDVKSISLSLPGVVGKYDGSPWLMRVGKAMLGGQTIDCYDPKAPFNNVIHVNTLAACIRVIIERNLFCNGRILMGSVDRLEKYEVLSSLKCLLLSQSDIQIINKGLNSFVLDVSKAKQMGLPLNTVSQELLKLADDLYRQNMQDVQRKKEEANYKGWPVSRM